MADFTPDGIPSFIAQSWTGWPLGLLDTNGNPILDTNDLWLNPTDHPFGIPVLSAGIDSFTAQAVATFEADAVATFTPLPEEAS